MTAASRLRGRSAARCVNHASHAVPGETDQRIAETETMPDDSDSPPPAGPQSVRQLSIVQLEILSLVVRHKSSRQIAEILGINHHMVDYHLKQVQAALGVTSRFQAARLYAAEAALAYDFDAHHTPLDTPDTPALRRPGGPPHLSIWASLPLDSRFANQLPAAFRLTIVAVLTCMLAVTLTIVAVAAGQAVRFLR